MVPPQLRPVTPITGTSVALIRRSESGTYARFTVCRRLAVMCGSSPQVEKVISPPFT